MPFVRLESVTFPAVMTEPVGSLTVPKTVASNWAHPRPEKSSATKKDRNMLPRINHKTCRVDYGWAKNQSQPISSVYSIVYWNLLELVCYVRISRNLRGHEALYSGVAELP